jgi:hypothetical protein
MLAVSEVHVTDVDEMGVGPTMPVSMMAEKSEFAASAKVCGLSAPML